MRTGLIIAVLAVITLAGCTTQQGAAGPESEQSDEPSLNTTAPVNGSNTTNDTGLDNTSAGRMNDPVREESLMELSSTAFENNEQMPDRFGYTNENVNPPLRFENVPEAAEELVLIMDDPDAMEPAGKVWDHWVLYNLDPGTTSIAEGETPENAVTGQNDYGELGYGGPNPPDREHTYVFTLYALDTALNLSEGASKADVESAIQDHILTKARLNGTFAPSQSN